MSLKIKNDEAERLAHELALATGESLTRAVTVAVRERLDRVQQNDESGAEDRARRTRKISGDAARRWVVSYGSLDHGNLLYDESGLPR